MRFKRKTVKNICGSIYLLGALAIYLIVGAVEYGASLWTGLWCIPVFGAIFFAGMWLNYDEYCRIQMIKARRAKKIDR